MTEIVPDFRAYGKQDNMPTYNDLGQVDCAGVFQAQSPILIPGMSPGVAGSSS